MTIPFWFILLKAHCYEKAGLTIPFLVGASARQRGAVAHPEDAKLIFSEMNTIKVPDSFFHIAVCARLQAPVITFVHYFGSGVKYDLAPEWGTNEQERITKLLLHAEGPIRNGNFSRIYEGNDRSWKPFQNDDLKQIDSAIKNYNVRFAAGV